jgi:glycosyltransferase involved in cell wall biosynthesis
VIPIFVNGRFLGQRITGAQRYARAMLQAIDNCLQKRQNQAQFSLAVLVPSETSGPPLVAGAVHPVGRLQGQLWEQLELPRHVGTGVLLNLCNTAPLMARSMVCTILDASVYAVPDAYSFGFRTWYRIMIPSIGRRSRQVITISDFSRGELQRYAGIDPSKTTVVRGSGEHVLQVPADDSVLQRLGLEPGGYVLAVSSQSRHKNLSGVSAAFRLLAGEHFQLVLAGGGNSRVFSAGALEGGDRVRITGYVTDPELRALYQHAGCLVYPSLYEGFGLPPLEAMTCGCPVIASRVASLPEVCGDAALYCDPNDPAEIARAIRSVMHDESLQNDLRRRGHERAATFRWTDSAESVLRLLEALPPR